MNERSGESPAEWVPGHPPGVDLPPAPAVRVIIDNDFAGDPDDLFQLAHHLLCPSVDIRAVISSHLAPEDPFDPGPHSARHGARNVAEIAALMWVNLDGLLLAGAEQGLVDERTPRDSVAVERIVAEARREADTPLYVVCGGGLTEVASALLVAPDIARRMTVVWIGGPEDPGLAEPPPGDPTPEYNLAIDVAAARVVLASEVELWQVPRNAYRQCLVSEVELRHRLRDNGPLGGFLYEQIRLLRQRIREAFGVSHDTYVMGDQPLVLLTALQTPFESSPASSDSQLRPAPQVGARGEFVADPGGRGIRVWTRIDTRLMFEDMFLRFAEHDRWLVEAGQG